ncbi:GtrA family protein [Tessaracoccus sp. OH4464_COT-324]|uniref:GtrA family protein n=1 Tax=Tessaracoccus sp. OH4464_COT-324 TaxID=2491059 RepID=UPI002101B20F|nr:GtrA family protein [Tessaracoccus sp. OH4464_COT-324]
MRRLFNRYRYSLWQFIKFGIVGGSGVFVNMAVNVLMNRINGGPENSQAVLFAFPGTPFNLRFTMVAWFVPFLVANVWNFQLNRWWTFKSHRAAGWWREFWPFFAVGSVAMLVGALLKWVMTNPASPLLLPEPYFTEAVWWRSREYWSQLIAIFLTLPINFVVNKLWTFKAVRGPQPETSGGA